MKPINNSTSIAVLPFVNMSDNKEDEYFADGMTEELINALAKITALKVTSRTSSFHFKNKNIPIPTIGKELGVSIILEGSVRRAGNTVRITAQLIQVKNDFHFWSETWDRKMDNIFAVQDEISLSIADRIREEFGHLELSDHLVLHQKVNINAYELSLLARFHKNKWNADDIKLAKRYYLESLSLEENNVAALVGLSDTYSFLAMTGLMSFEEAWSKSNELVDKALQLDPQNSEAYYQKANKSFFTESSYSKAMEHALQAIHFQPNYVEAQQFLSFLYILAGNKEKALNHLNIALSIDPLSQETHFFRAYYHYMTGQFELALNELNACLAVNPKNIPAHGVKPLCLLLLKRYDEVTHYFKDHEVSMNPGDENGVIALAYAMKNDQEQLNRYRKILQDLAANPNGFSADSYLFNLNVVLGEFDEAFKWVEEGIKNKASLLILRYPDPIVSPLRKDPRYQKFHDIIFKLHQLVDDKKVSKSLLDEEQANQFQLKLLNYINQYEPFLDSSLSLRELAKQIDIHPNQLSWLLNAKLGKSFSEFINSYRLDRFKQLALNPENQKLTLLGLAYDSGFNSKTVFNTYFKKSVGKSPKAWLLDTKNN